MERRPEQLVDVGDRRGRPQLERAHRAQQVPPQDACVAPRGREVLADHRVVAAAVPARQRRDGPQLLLERELVAHGRQPPFERHGAHRHPPPGVDLPDDVLRVGASAVVEHLAEVGVAAGEVADRTHLDPGLVHRHEQVRDATVAAVGRRRCGTARSSSARGAPPTSRSCAPRSPTGRRRARPGCAGSPGRNRHRARNSPGTSAPCRRGCREGTGAAAPRCRARSASGRAASRPRRRCGPVLRRARTRPRRSAAGSARGRARRRPSATTCPRTRRARAPAPTRCGRRRLRTRARAHPGRAPRRSRPRGACVNHSRTSAANARSSAECWRSIRYVPAPSGSVNALFASVCSAEVGAPRDRAARRTDHDVLHLDVAVAQRGGEQLDDELPQIGRGHELLRAPGEPQHLREHPRRDLGVVVEGDGGARGRARPRCAGTASPGTPCADRRPPGRARPSTPRSGPSPGRQPRRCRMPR